MSTIASNTERGSCELAAARLNGNRRIRKWLGRIDRPRAQRYHPPPVAGTGARPFNAPAILSPNLTVVGNVIGSKHPSNPHFSQLYPLDKQEYKLAQCDSRDVVSRCPSRHPESVRRSIKSYAVLDPRANAFLPREESGDESQHLNRSGCDNCHDVQACPHSSQSETMHKSRIQKHAQSSPKYPVTRRPEATPVRRPRVGQRTMPLSSLILLPTPCNLGLPFEL